MEKKLKLEADWEEVKEKLKEVNTSLTDDDLRRSDGGDEELIDRLAAKLNRSPEQIKDWIESVSFNKGKAS